MDRNKRSQSEYSRGGVTPEESLDRQLLSGGYMMAFIVIASFVVMAEGCVGLLPRWAAAAMAGGIAALVSIFLAMPLFWEVDGSGHYTRRICRTAFFPISKRRFVCSKFKLMGFYGMIFWVASLIIQLLFALVFGTQNIVLYQGTLAAAYAVDMLLFTLAGTIGAH